MPEDGHDQEPLPNKALMLLFQAEHKNYFRAAEQRRASTSFQLVEERGIILLQGRKYDTGPVDNL